MVTTSTAVVLAAATNAPTAYPAIAGLGLDAEQLGSLAGRGYLERVKRRPGYPGYWRLRYRYAGKQKTAYLGNDPERVANVRRELEQIQLNQRLRRALQRAGKHASTTIRVVKKKLAPILDEWGYHYHGDLVRKTRKPASPKPE